WRRAAAARKLSVVAAASRQRRRARSMRYLYASIEQFRSDYSDLHGWHTTLVGRAMRSLVFASVLATACTTAPSNAGATADDGKGDSAATGTATHDCVIDTLQVNDGVELGLALAAAIDPQFIKDFGPEYDRQIQVPNGLASPIVTTDEFGSYIYSFH